MTGEPLIVSVACPFPMEPKMKFESRTGIDSLAPGKITLGASGPSTMGTAGNGGAFRGVIPRSNVGTVGGETGGLREGLGVGEDGVGTGAD